MKFAFPIFMGMAVLLGLGLPSEAMADRKLTQAQKAKISQAKKEIRLTPASIAKELEKPHKFVGHPAFSALKLADAGIAPEKVASHLREVINEIIAVVIEMRPLAAATLRGPELAREFQDVDPANDTDGRNEVLDLIHDTYSARLALAFVASHGPFGFSYTEIAQTMRQIIETAQGDLDLFEIATLYISTDPDFTEIHENLKVLKLVSHGAVFPFFLDLFQQRIGGEEGDEDEKPRNILMNAVRIGLEIEKAAGCEQELEKKAPKKKKKRKSQGNSDTDAPL